VENMSEDDFTIFGSSMKPGGALLHMKGDSGLQKGFESILRESLKLKGIQIDSQVERAIKKIVQEKLTAQKKMLSSLGVPEVFKSLFALGKKSEVEKYCKNLKISDDDLFLLIHNHKDLGLTHQLQKKEFVPEFLRIELSDIKKINQSGTGGLGADAKKTIKKIASAFDQRKANHCHLFQKGNAWFCIYFSYEDITKGSENHWESGPHIHFTSSLWMNKTAKEVLEMFNEREIRKVKSFHIRYFEKENDSNNL
jgi:hypothetical protein